jgi:hypothetical protein
MLFGYLTLSMTRVKRTQRVAGSHLLPPLLAALLFPPRLAPQLAPQLAPLLCVPGCERLALPRTLEEPALHARPYHYKAL